MFPRYLTISIFLICALLSAACAHQAVFMGSQAPSMVSQAGDRHVLAREWEYIDSTGAVVPLTLDEQGNGHYEWKEGRGIGEAHDCSIPFWTQAQNWGNSEWPNVKERAKTIA